MRRYGFWLLVLLWALSPACRKQPDDMPLRIVLSRYFHAIQEGDMQAMSRDLALFEDVKSRYGDTGEAILTFKQTVNEILSEYRKERDEGAIHFDPYGIKAAHIMGLGRGFYYRTVSVRYEGNQAELELAHSFAYDTMDYSVFPKGTKLYFLTCPAGSVRVVVTGEYQKGYRLNLKRVHTRWRFRKNANGDWKIVSMAVLPDTAECEQSRRALY